ncbi:MAG: protein kinase [Deltaproteobacteria bacterium]|nr:protein kinase [Deltaproteobacteria bacterium]MBN2673979.1 protein kinase [Deltaproteobacteria bacterium]
MIHSVWYCPLCYAEGIDNGVTHCPQDGTPVKSIAEREARWIGQTIDKKYKVVRFIGAGGMADVFEVERVSSDKRLALKLLKSVFTRDAQLSERFRQEAMMISLIAHRNIVSLEDFGILPDNTNYMVMELLSGYSLGDALQMGPIPPTTAFRIILQACEGMAAAHERGVIHRDLKPDNIFIHTEKNNPDPVVKILDLGIGKLFNNAATRGLTLSGTVVGTPEYMSPEQCKGLNAGVPSDIYSMGIVLYEMLFGNVPFDDESPLLVLPRQISEVPQWDDANARALRIPDETKQVILRALNKDPAKRQETMLDLQRDVANLLSRMRHGGQYSLPSPDALKSLSLIPGHHPAAAPTLASMKSEPYLVADDTNWSQPVPLEIAPDTYWVGRRHETQLECNSWLRVFRGNGQQIALLIDPGPLRDLDVVCSKTAAIIDSIDNLNYMFINHQDPDVAGNAAEIQRINPRVMVICSEDTWRLARHYGLDAKRYISTESLPGQQIRFNTGHTLQFIASPFCHSRGAVMLYDSDSRILFSGDLFGGTNNRPGFIYTPEDGAGIHLFHQVYMPSKRALQRAINSVKQLSPKPRIIAPQHGVMITDNFIPAVLTELSHLNVGVDLIEVNEQNTEQIALANEVLRVYSHIAGKKKLRTLVDLFRSEQTLVSIFEFREPGQIVSIKIDSNVAISTLLRQAEINASDDERKQLQRSFQPIRKKLQR